MLDLEVNWQDEIFRNSLMCSMGGIHAIEITVMTPLRTWAVVMGDMCLENGKYLGSLATKELNQQECA
jgi:hypothetical protein